MAAELENLIKTYRARGLTEAADFLAVGKEGLQAKGLIPPHLDPEVELSEFGVFLQGKHGLRPEDNYEIDTLGLRIQTRRALL